MNLLDERLGAAVQDLRSELDQVDPPPFRPNRSTTPLVFALVVLLGLGAVGYVMSSRSDDTGGISIATQPEAPDQQLAVEDLPEPDPRDDEPEEEATPLARTGQLTRAEDGEIYIPIPGASAWSRDESWVLMYRTGAAKAGHVVLDVRAVDNELVDLPFTPPDIEQVYWHPLQDNELLYAQDDAVFAFDVATSRTRLVHRFEGCDSIDSGVLPVPPAQDGSLSLLCHSGDGSTQVVLDLDTLVERRTETASDSAAFPSPSGERLVRWNADGSASVLDRELRDTGVVLDLESNLFAFVLDEMGMEWIAATLFDGPAIGTIVLLPLDGLGDPIVVIGPDRGDEYPPEGNDISAAGSRIIVSTRGPSDGPIVGNITVVDVDGRSSEPRRLSYPHDSEGQFDYWSNPFVSLSPSGQAFVYSTDQGFGFVNTFMTTIISLPE